MTEYPQITALPTPPNRGQDEELFAQLADAFMDALPQFRDQLNAFGAQLVAATIERVVNEAAASYAGALDAKNAAIQARDAAAGYAASIDPTKFVKLLGDQTIDGGKTFAKKIIATLGIRIGDVDLTALTTAGKALIEAADAAAQKAALGITAVVQDFTSSGTWTKPAGAKSVQIVMWGGGGGGSGGGYDGNSAYPGAGGSGAGYVSVHLAAADVAATVSVTVGAGGTGGAGGSGAAGGNGGATVFGPLFAPGGTGPVNGDFTPQTAASMFVGGYGGRSSGINYPGGEGWKTSGGNSGEPGQFPYSGGKGGSPCPGGGAGRSEPNGNGQPAGAGGAGALRGPASFYGGGGAASVNNTSAAAATGGAGAARIGIIPGTGGGGGSMHNQVGYPGGAGGSGAGGGGGAGGYGGSGAGGAGGVGFCRVTTFF